MGKAEDAVVLAEAGINFAHEVLDMFSKVAPTLGPMLGVFGAATGVLKSLTQVWNIYFMNTLFRNKKILRHNVLENLNALFFHLFCVIGNVLNAQR